MPRTRKPYAPEFREQMVALVRAGRSPEELSRECEPSAQSMQPAKFVTTTVADLAADRALDKVDRQFSADGPDRLWVADITYLPTWSGFLYLAIVLDVWSRRIVGWAMANHLKTELVLDALDRRSHSVGLNRSSIIPTARDLPESCDAFRIEDLSSVDADWIKDFCEGVRSVRPKAEWH